MIAQATDPLSQRRQLADVTQPVRLQRLKR
jgi:hypothetical protein